MKKRFLIPLGLCAAATLFAGPPDALTTPCKDSPRDVVGDARSGATALERALPRLNYAVRQYPESGSAAFYALIRAEALYELYRLSDGGVLAKAAPSRTQPRLDSPEKLRREQDFLALRLDALVWQKAHSIPDRVAKLNPTSPRELLWAVHALRLAARETDAPIPATCKNLLDRLNRTPNADPFDRLQTALAAKILGAPEAAQTALSKIDPAELSGKKSRLYRSIEAQSRFLDALSWNGGAWKSGVYRAKAPGYLGDVDVTVTVGPDGRIANVRAVGKDDRPWGSFVSVPNRIVRAGTPVVDATTGATASSIGVMLGAAKALEQAAAR